MQLLVFLTNFYKMLLTIVNAGSVVGLSVVNGAQVRVVNRAKKRCTGTERHGTGKCTGGTGHYFGTVRV